MAITSLMVYHTSLKHKRTVKVAKLFCVEMETVGIFFSEHDLLFQADVADNDEKCPSDEAHWQACDEKYEHQLPCIVSYRFCSPKD